MKVLVISQHFYPETFRINDIVFSLADLGHRMTVITGLPNYPSGKIDSDYRFLRKRHEVIQNVTVFRSPIIGRGNSVFRMGLNYISFALSASIKVFFTRENYDAIFVFQTSPVSMILPGLVAKKKYHIPLIVYCLDQWPISVTTGPISENSLIYKALFYLSHWLYKHSDRILLSSTSFKSYFEKTLHLDTKRYGLNYWPSYAESIYNDILYLDNKVFDLVFAGNIGPAQNVEFIVKAAALLKDNTFIHFHIVGDGLNLKQCETLANNFKLTNLTFYGHHPLQEMKKFYTLADAFIITMVNNPVVNSTLPAKMQSYLSAGKPIIAAISGEVESLMKEAQCGWISSNNDLKGLIKNILEASSNIELSHQLGKNGLNYYKSKFDKNVLLNVLIDTLKETNYHAH